MCSPFTVIPDAIIQYNTTKFCSLSCREKLSGSFGLPFLVPAPPDFFGPRLQQHWLLFLPLLFPLPSRLMSQIEEEEATLLLGPWFLPPPPPPPPPKSGETNRAEKSFFFPLSSWGQSMAKRFGNCRVEGRLIASTKKRKMQIFWGNKSSCITYFVPALL